MTGISSDTQLGLAYNAALQVSTAALAAAGYRAAREKKHYVTLQSLIHTIGADARLVARLDAFRKKRNIGDYERAGATSPKEAKEDLHDQVRAWIEKSRPELPLDLHSTRPPRQGHFQGQTPTFCTEIPSEAKVS